MYFHPNIPSPGTRDEPSSSKERRDGSIGPGIDHLSGPHGRVHKILLPMDDSASALGAMAYLTGSLNRGRPLEVHVINVQRLSMRGDFALNVAVRAEQRARLAAARRILARARALLDAAGIPCKTTLLFGDAGRAIGRFAREQVFDEIVMGTRGLAALNRMCLGSVAAKVVSRTDLPVTVVRAARQSPTPMRVASGSTAPQPAARTLAARRAQFLYAQSARLAIRELSYHPGSGRDYGRARM